MQLFLVLAILAGAIIYLVMNVGSLDARMTELEKREKERHIDVEA